MLTANGLTEYVVFVLRGLTEKGTGWECSNAAYGKTCEARDKEARTKRQNHPRAEKNITRPFRLQASGFWARAKNKLIFELTC